MARILVVEDEASVARIVTHYLTRAGHTAVVAPDGETAIHAAGAHPDLILLDIGLPDMSGADVLCELKRNPHTAATPVVIVSGDPRSAMLVADGGGRAVAAILRKPVYFRELCDVVDAVLRTPAGWDDPHGGVPERRAALLYRLITEGSNTLVRLVCLRLDADRACGYTRPHASVPDWAEVARAGRQEGLLSVEEGALLAPAPALAGH